MTTLTITIPEDLAKQAQAIGVLNEEAAVQAFAQFVRTRSLQKSPIESHRMPKRIIGTGVGTIIDMPEDFNDPLTDFSEYM